jgi:hypothetical protein
MTNNNQSLLQRCVQVCAVSALVLVLYAASALVVEAAALSLSPSTGVYTTGGTFSVRVQVQTGGQPVNAAEGTITFNPKELSVVSVNRSSSIFNLWIAEPSFSNSAGTISFSGGVPSGYTGQTGTVMNITFRTLTSGTGRVSFKNGSVLANDGRGTNILTAMNGGNYTIQAPSLTPEPEVIEYVAPANTPAAPVVTSLTHPDPAGWYASSEAVLTWTLPAGVTALRTLLNDNPTSVPTKVYDTPIDEITLSDLPEGESYFHVQFKNADGWGRVTHYRLAVDTVNPTTIKITQPAEVNLTNPEQTVLVAVTDETSAVRKLIVKVDTTEPYEVTLSDDEGLLSLPPLEPGYHTLIIEAFDQAGNSIVGTYSFDISSFAKPVFTDFPTEINEEVIPVIKGETRPKAEVTIHLSRVGGEPSVYQVTSDAAGHFNFIPEGTFSTGVYELYARATDEFGAVSEPSDRIRIAVQQPGYLRVGTLLVSVLSVVVPMLVMLVMLVLGLWYLVAYAKRFRRRVRVESTEALDIVRTEFTALQAALREHEAKMQASRKTKKLTKAETAMVEGIDLALQISQQKVEKEIEDVTKLTRKPKT